MSSSRSDDDLAFWRGLLLLALPAGTLWGAIIWAALRWLR